VIAHPDRELLAAHADGAAPAAERAGLETHLGACESCRKEVAGFKAVSKLVADLPQSELPIGFMARLERRRREGEAAPAAFTMPGLSPWRLAGFAATGLLVCLVFFREVRYRLAPQMLGDGAFSEADTGIRSSVSVGPADEVDDGAVAAARQAAAERGAWQGLSEEAAPAQNSAMAPQAAAEGIASGDERRELMAVAKAVSGRSALVPASRAKLKAGGGPLGDQAGATNEQLQAHLEKERSRMGIQQVVAPGSPAPSATDGIPDRPLSKDEAMDYMRTMTRNLSRLNRDADAKKRPTIDLGSGATPRILGDKEASQPLDGSGMKADAKKNAAEAKGSLGMIRGSVRVDEPASFEPPPMRAPAFMAGRSQAAASGSGGAAGAPAAGAPVTSAPAAPPKPLVPRGFWSATLGGLGSDGGAVITKAEDWADLWRRVGRTEPLPAVDFSKEMAVAVFGKRDAENRRSVEIVSLSEESGSLMIRYRLKDEGVKAPSAPYHVVVAPKSELPFEFVQVK